MKKLWLAAIIPAVLSMAIVAGVIALFVVKLLWAWTIPDLFPGAVKQGLIAAEISWLTAFKLALFIGLMAGFTRGASHKECSDA